MQDGDLDIAYLIFDRCKPEFNVVGITQIVDFV